MISLGGSGGGKVGGSAMIVVGGVVAGEIIESFPIDPGPAYVPEGFSTADPSDSNSIESFPIAEEMPPNPVTQPHCPTCWNRIWAGTTGQRVQVYKVQFAWVKEVMMTGTDINDCQNNTIELQPDKVESTILLLRNGGYCALGNVDGARVEVIFEPAKLFINPTESPRLHVMGNGDRSGYYSFDAVVGLKEFAQHAVVGAIPSEANLFRSTFPQLFEG